MVAWGALLEWPIATPRWQAVQLQDADEFAAWLRLLETPGIGRERAAKLLAAFGSPQGVFKANPSALTAVVGPVAAQQLQQEPDEYPARLAAALAWWRERPHHHVFSVAESIYPSALLNSADPPLLLYASGRLELLQSANALAVVGSRHPSAQGKDNAREFGRYLSQAGWTVVSGMALGIDGAAHEGALEGSGSTIAVVGTGLNEAYPRRHQGLAKRIAEHGLLLSEFAPGTPPLPANFPSRNRIIAGLTRGTLVVEAALQSGSLITARLALESGRDVFAVPGSIHSPQSKGCHALLKQGAKLVECGQDILDEFGAMAPPLAHADTPDVAGAVSEPRNALLDALGHDPTSFDALSERTGWPAHELHAKLLEMELQNLVARLPGGLFQRRSAT